MLGDGIIPMLCMYLLSDHIMICNQMLIVEIVYVVITYCYDFLIFKKTLICTPHYDLCNTIILPINK